MKAQRELSDATIPEGNFSRIMNIISIDAEMSPASLGFLLRRYGFLVGKRDLELLLSDKKIHSEDVCKESMVVVSSRRQHRI